MAADRPGRGSDQFALRLPDGMRDRIKAAADARGRSMNTEIIATLEEKYPAPPEPDAMKKFILGRHKDAGFLSHNDPGAKEVMGNAVTGWLTAQWHGKLK